MPQQVVDRLASPDHGRAPVAHENDLGPRDAVVVRAERERVRTGRGNGEQVAALYKGLEKEPLYM